MRLDGDAAVLILTCIALSLIAVILLTILVAAVLPQPLFRICDSSYPDFCLDPDMPDLDCDDVPWDDFAVIPPDPHGFDADRDGTGCETR